MEYINRNYSSFRTQIHEDKDKAINEEYSGNYLVGPRKTLLVDPQKDIDVKYIAIGGVEREDKSIEESHEIVKCKPADNLEIASWNSLCVSWMNIMDIILFNKKRWTDYRKSSKEKISL